MRESVILSLIHILAIISAVSPSVLSTKGKKIIRQILKRYLNRETEDEFYSLFENNLEFYNSELGSLDKTELSVEGSLLSFQINNVCRQLIKKLLLEDRMIIFLSLLEFAFAEDKISEQEKILIDIIAKAFNISEKEYDNAMAFMIEKDFDKVSPECMLIAESDDPALFADLTFSRYEKWRHIRINGFKGHLFVLHIESTGSLIVIYDGKMKLHFKGVNIIAGRPYLLERGVNIKGHGIESIYYSRIYKKFASRKFFEKVTYEGHGIEFSFRNSDNGIQQMNFRIESGNMIGLMGEAE